MGEVPSINRDSDSMRGAHCMRSTTFTGYMLSVCRHFEKLPFWVVALDEIEVEDVPEHRETTRVLY